MIHSRACLTLRSPNPSNHTSSRLYSSTIPPRNPPPNSSNEPEFSNLHLAATTDELERQTEPQPESPPTEDNEALSKYHEAFEQEFTQSSRRTASAKKNIDDVFIANGERAALSIVALAAGARSEMTRLHASKFVIEYVRDLDGGIGGDPVLNLLDRLQANPEVMDSLPTPATSTNDENVEAAFGPGN